MTGQRFDLRRPIDRPAGGLFRASAASAALTFPLLWLFTAWAPFGPEPCIRVCPGSIPEYDDVFFAIPSTAVVELVVVGVYLAVVLLRRTADADILRWLPVSVGVVVLAVAPLPPLSSADSELLAPLPLLWILVPLVLYFVNRGDDGAAKWVLLALAPSCVMGALVVQENALAALPAGLLVATAVAAVGIRYA